MRTMARTVATRGRGAALARRDSRVPMQGRARWSRSPGAGSSIRRALPASHALAARAGRDRHVARGTVRPDQSADRSSRFSSTGLGRHGLAVEAQRCCAAYARQGRQRSARRSKAAGVGRLPSRRRPRAQQPESAAGNASRLAERPQRASTAPSTGRSRAAPEARDRLVRRAGAARRAPGRRRRHVASAPSAAMRARGIAERREIGARQPPARREDVRERRRPRCDGATRLAVRATSVAARWRAAAR